MGSYLWPVFPVTGTENFIGNGLPYDLGMAQYEAIPLTSNSDTIYIGK